MTAQHTKGRLKLGRVSHSEQSAEIDAESNTAWMDAYPWEGLAECRGCEENKTRGASVMEANARRLVACWNACEGISTTEVEAAARSGSIAYALERLIIQRDDLLGALKEIAAAGIGSVAPGFADIARAAIAKVEGGAA